MSERSEAAERARRACIETAQDALTWAAEVDVDCMRYCYGGTGRVDVETTIEQLAEIGWRLTPFAERPEPSTDTLRKALERIATGDVPGTGDFSDCVQRFAREALAATPAREDEPSEHCTTCGGPCLLPEDKG